MACRRRHCTQPGSKMAASAASGKKIAGLQPKVAIGLALVVAIGVYLYLRNRSANAAVPTQTQTTPQVAATGGTDPNATGGVTQAPDMSGLLDALLTQSQTLASAFANYQPTVNSPYTYNAGQYEGSTNYTTTTN